MKRVIVVLLVLTFLCGLAACAEENPRPTLPKVTSKDLVFTSERIIFSEVDNGLGAVYGLNTTMEICNYNGVQYAFEKAVPMKERIACVQATEAVRNRLAADQGFCVHVYAQDTYGKMFVKGNGIYTYSQQWQSPEYVAALIQSIFGAYTNYGAAYGYGSYLCRELFGQDLPVCDGYNGELNILDMNALCFQSRYFNVKDIKAARRVANTFVSRYIEEYGEKDFQTLLRQSGDPDQVSLFAAALAQFYGDLGIDYTPSTLLSRLGGVSYDYIIKSAYAELFVEVDWKDGNQGLCPEYYEGFLHANYRDIREYFTVIIDEMAQYQTLCRMDNCDNNLKVYFTNYYGKNAIAYVKSSHSLAVRTISSFSTGYLSSIMEQAQLRQASWAITGFAQIYGQKYNRYGNLLYNYITNVTSAEKGSKYREAYLKCLGRDVDFNTDLYVLHHIEVCIDQLTDPNKNYISGGSFVAYLSQRFGEEEVVEIALHGKEFDGVAYEELVEDWLAFLEENYQQYAG